MEYDYTAFDSEETCSLSKATRARTPKSYMVSIELKGRMISVLIKLSIGQL